jgi:hypothetical protein
LLSYDYRYIPTHSPLFYAGRKCNSESLVHFLLQCAIQFTDYSQQQSHPLLPIPLLLVASSLNSAITHITIPSDERQNSVKVLLGLLRYMSHSNQLASTILQKIEADDITSCHKNQRSAQCEHEHLVLKA